MNYDSLKYVTEFTPKEIGNRLYSIPLYQRLYSWESNQVKQLLDDLHDNYEKSLDNPLQYFIGNIVISSADKHTQRNALIDGQQRMTTFWLMGFVLKEHHNDWSHFIQKENQLRLDFVARDEDRVFLKTLSETNIHEFKKKQKIEGINPIMINAIDEIWTFMNDKQVSDKSGFARYIYEYTKIVEVTLPGSTDLNKYFEIMNNRGVQLEKHEILKARLIEKIIDTNDRIRYAGIWDACSQMNHHIERCFEKTEEIEEEQVLIKREISYQIKNNFTDIDSFIRKLTSGSNKNEKTFQEILKDAEDPAKSNSTPKGQNKKGDEGISSIVSFSSFLLHVYKIWHKDFDISLKDKDLLKIVQLDESSDKEQSDLEAKSFIKELLIMRILFDQFIIKSYRNGTNSLWEIQILAIDGEENKRKKDFENSAQILAMLNVSTSIEHWLSPALKYLREVKLIEDNVFAKWLENLDNYFAWARLNAPNNLMRIANETLADICKNKSNAKIDIPTDILSRGTNTDRYWFYKLDYCLWKKWSTEENDLPWKTHIKGFQFRSNRSIEHIYPQHPENGNYWDEVDLNSFGNLALISVSSNSSYNCQLPKEKKFDFDKRTSTWGIESLKLVDIYRREEWSTDVCNEHQEEMIEILNEYHLVSD